MLWVAVGLVLLAGLVWLRLRSRAGPDVPSAVKGALIPPGVLIESQPLLTETEAAFYNLLRLAVQDRYLVFAQIPVWCLLNVKSSDRAARAAFLSRIALKRLDFVLVHPGTLKAEKVVELEVPSEASPQKQERNRLIDEIAKRGGIELVRVNPQETHTVPELAVLLDIQPDD